jgi:hypothetical protein
MSLPAPGAFPDHSRIIINAVPKSGTYLLTKLIGALGHFKNQEGLHLNDQHYSSGSDTGGRLCVLDIPAPNNFAALRPGHSCASHLTWSKAAEVRLRQDMTGMLFMYRDPRDIVISYMKFAMYSDVYRFQTPGHAQYYDFLCTLENDQRRVEHILRERLFLFQFYEMASWLFSDACLAVSFETLYADVLGLEQGFIGDTLARVMAYQGIFSLPYPPQHLFEAVHGNSTTAMPGRDKLAVYKSFFDDDLRNAANDAYFKSILHLYGYPRGD